MYKDIYDQIDKDTYDYIELYRMIWARALQMGHKCIMAAKPMSGVICEYSDG